MKSRVSEKLLEKILDLGLHIVIRRS